MPSASAFLYVCFYFKILFLWVYLDLTYETETESESRSVLSDSLQPHGLQSSRFLCLWGFSRQEYWSELPSPPPGDLPAPGIKPGSPALQMDSLPSEMTRQVNSGKQGVTENHFRNWMPIPSIEIELIPLCWFAFCDLATWTLILVGFFFFWRCLRIFFVK